MVMAAVVAFTDSGSSYQRKEPRPMTQPEPWVIAAFAGNTKSIHYMHNLGWTGSKMAAFSYHGPSDVWVTYGYDSPPQIGAWRTTLDAALIASAQQVLHASNYRTIPGPARHRPDTKFAGFREEPMQGEGRRMTAFPLAEIPPAVQAAVKKFDELVELVKAHPVRVVRGVARWSKTTLDTDEELGVELELTNVGSASLNVANPFEATEHPKGSIRLALRAVANSPEGEVVEFGSADVVTRRALERSPILTLAAKRTWKVRLARRVHLLPGRYTGVLTYRSGLPSKEDGPDIKGELPMVLGEIDVRAPH
jgi:hypothetical protein